MECNIVMSGVPQMACWGEFSIVICGNMAYVQMAATSRTGKYQAAFTPIQSSSIGLSTVVVRTPSDLFDTGQSGRLPPGTGGITIGERSCRSS